MAIVSSGNVRGPEGAYKEYGVLPAGATFALSLEDVVNGVFFLKAATGDVVNLVTGTTFTLPNDYLVLEVQVTAQVAV